MNGSTTPVSSRFSGLRKASFALSGIGLATSIYLTYEHFTGSTSLLCSEQGAVDCAKVTTSQWSMLAGVPVALLGLLFYLAMTLLTSPPGWRLNARLGDALRLLATAGGLVFVFYLVWAELFKIHAICLWCTVVHVTTLVLLLVLISERMLREDT